MSTEHNENSRLKNTMRVSVAGILLTVILLSFNQCVVSKSESGKLKTSLTTGGSAGDIASNNPAGGLTMPPLNAPTSPSANDEIDVGVKSFEQIFLSMSASTGLPPNYADGSLSSAYTTLSTSLPLTNDIKSFLPNNQIAVTKLSAEFCQRLLEDTTLRAAIWPTMNFNQTPKVMFAAANKAANKMTIINQAMDRFLPPMDATTRADTYEMLDELFEDLLSGVNENDAGASRVVVKGMCITTLSSAYATIL